MKLFCGLSRTTGTLGIFQCTTHEFPFTSTVLDVDSLVDVERKTYYLGELSLLNLLLELFVVFMSHVTMVEML